MLLLSDNEMLNDKSFEHMNPDEEKGNNFWAGKENNYIILE